jgi:hypothetical protein
MSFTHKQISVQITLGQGQFGEDGSNQVTLTNHRTVVNIGCAGGESMGALQMRMYGLRNDLINTLTTIGPINSAIRARNTISISAGDNVTGLSEIYVGTINEAWGDYQGAPEVSFNVTGFAGLLEAVKPVQPISFQGSADVATIMSGLAKTMGVNFENNGVTAQLSNPYLPGTAWQQVQACARAADIRFALDRSTLSIWPKNGARAGGIPVISPATGLVGYPSFASNGLTVTIPFNPNIQIGGQIQVQSSVQMANGIWTVFNINHAIESEQPGGSWFTQIQCYPGTDTGLTSQ